MHLVQRGKRPYILAMPDDLRPNLREEPYEVVNGDVRSGTLILCDHASNIVPQDVNGGTLGLPDADMNRHIAWDIGAAGVSVELARLMNAPAILSRFSRLVIDPNRGEDDPTLVMRLYDGTIIPGNRHVKPEDVEYRLNRFHRPYHDEVTRLIDRAEEFHPQPALISVHSYTPQLKGRGLRPWHVGVLWDADGRIAEPLIERLRQEDDLCIGDNQPYSGQLKGDTMSRHGTDRGFSHVLIELRHDLIDTASTQKAWAARLAPILGTIIDETRARESENG